MSSFVVTGIVVMEICVFSLSGDLARPREQSEVLSNIMGRSPSRLAIILPNLAAMNIVVVEK